MLYMSRDIEMTDVHNTFKKSPEVELICAETDVVSAGSRVTAVSDDIAIQITPLNRQQLSPSNLSLWGAQTYGECHRRDQSEKRTTASEKEWQLKKKLSRRVSVNGLLGNGEEYYSHAATGEKISVATMDPNLLTAAKLYTMSTWIRKQKGDGSVMYLHKVTGECILGGKAEEDQGDEWDTFYSEEHDAPYFVHRLSRKTSWVKDSEDAAKEHAEEVTEVAADEALADEAPVVNDSVGVSETLPDPHAPLPKETQKRRRPRENQGKTVASSTPSELERIRERIIKARLNANGDEAEAEQVLHERFGIDICSHRGEWIEVYDEESCRTVYFCKENDRIESQRPQGWYACKLRHRQGCGCCKEVA